MAGPTAPIDKKIHNASTPCLHACQLALYGLRVTEEAERLFVQVMETCKTKLGADHPDTLSSMANLAFTWKSQGRHADALALMVACAQAQQRILGPEHPYTLSSLTTVDKWSG